jgi:monofunctional biosynthetic peptidoglycan transglycosylase
MSFLSIFNLKKNHPATTSFMSFRARAGGAEAAPCRVEWCDLDSISPLLSLAVIKLEDTPFFQHRGLHVANIFEKIKHAALRGARIQAVSTITMQLARNLYLTPERRLSRKAQEVAAAVLLEVLLPKRRILELYLNVVEWGPDVWGAKQAARHYFEKSTLAIDTFEACLLASLIPAPLQPLNAPNRNRIRFAQNLAASSLFLSGIIGGPECSRVLKRIRVFHELLSRDVSFRDAVQLSLKESADEPDRLVGVRGDDSPLSPKEALEAGGGWLRQQEEVKRIRARYGSAELLQFLRVGDPRLLTDRERGSPKAVTPIS